ncbi:MAG: SGNH/GDSL hydrolase family protein [Burkholderiales bacterium]|nr:SGNH/GDSL hydrolase family protein [Burkholderiales bacterium]
MRTTDGRRSSRARGVARVLIALLAAALAAPAAGARCVASPGLLDLGVALPKTRAAIETRKAVEIVALGSSSTQGYGASTALKTYPAELLRVLSRDLPGVKVNVYNKGIGGQEVGAMLERLDRDVFAETPDLVIWQLGTNAALRRFNIESFRRLVGEGVERMKARGIEIVLMTPQYAPAVLALPNEEEYLAAMAKVAREKDVGLFDRFRIMQDWFDREHMAYSEFLVHDGLHLNDFGYQCIGRLLAQAIEQAVRKGGRDGVSARPPAAGQAGLASRR